MGLLDGITDPVVMAKIEERNRLVDKIAGQMGVSRDEARQALFNFEAADTSEGQTLH
jgi:hypothetical protein